MALLYTISAPGVTFSPNKCMWGLFNNIGSGKIIKLISLQILNNQTVSVTGVNCLLTLNTLSTGSGGIDILPLKHDSTNPTIPSQIVFATNLTYTSSNILRRIPWSNDEPLAAGTNTIDEIYTNPEIGYLVDNRYYLNDQTVEPFCARPGEGLALINNTVTAVGLCDIFGVIKLEDI